MRLLVIAAALSLSACITPQVTQKATGVDFKAFKTVAYSVISAPDIKLDRETFAFGQQEVLTFKYALGQRLKTMGYDVVQDCAAADFCLDVSVTEAKKGSSAARFIVGFGAGRAVLLFNAAFTAQGRQFASFHGGNTVTGMIPHEQFMAGVDVENVAVTHSTSQITEFILNNGDIPQPPPRPIPRM